MASERKKLTKHPRIKPQSSGAGLVLGHLEAEVMNSLWQESPASVRDVLKSLVKKRTLAYTTIMTVMSRLVDKGLLKREQQGRTYLYTPTQTYEEFSSETIGSIFIGMIKGFGDPVLTHFIESVGTEDADKLDELIGLIDEEKKKRANQSPTPP